MKWNHITGGTYVRLPGLLIAACCLLMAYAPIASAQTYGLRSSNWTGSYNPNPTAWFDCRNWDNAAPDRYTNATVDGSVTIADNGTHKARAASLTIDTNTGVLTIERGGELEISRETTTPANTRRFDEWTWLTSHNSHASQEYNTLYAQQDHSIREQLDDGVRGLMLDVYDWEGIDDQDLYLCHGDCGIPFLNPNTLGEGAAIATVAVLAPQVVSCLGGLVPACKSAALTLGVYVLADEIARMKLAHGLAEVRQFLDANPNEIVTLIVENYPSDADINQRLVDAGVAGYMYDPAIDHPEGKTGCWPSTAWMVANGKRLVVMVQNPATGDLPGRILAQRDYAVENMYDIGLGEENYDPACPARWDDLNVRTRKLFVMNHFASVVLPTYIDIFSDFTFGLTGSNNGYDKILSRVDGQCFAAAQRYPNFLAVDFYDYPSNGPNEVVATLNARWTPDGPGYNVPASSTIASASLVSAASGDGAAVFEDAALLEAELEEVPEAYGLKDSYPNPFSIEATIQYVLPEEAEVSVIVYDILGRTVAILVQGRMTVGRHAAVLKGDGLSSGTYIVRMATDTGFAQARRMILMR